LRLDNVRRAALAWSVAAVVAGSGPRAQGVPAGEAAAEEGDAEAGIAGAAAVGQTVVTATRYPRVALDTPYATEVVDSDRIRERAYRTAPQALRDMPGVMVQETAHGQGSPYIRGFTGFRNVFLIDGIRLNNSVFRDGPNQYWNTVDPLSVDRLEVIKGPSSVLYGSDAVGGTVNALTKSPYTYGPGTNVGGQFYYRVASAEESHIGRAELSASSGDALGVLVGVSGKTFGDLQGGRDIGTQPDTGYDEWDADLKLERFLDPDTRLVVAYQHVRQNDVPRTHRTVFAQPFEGTTVRSDLRRDLDQERHLAYVQLHGENADAFFDSYSVSLSWHEQEELRDRIRGNGTRELQGFDVDSLGFLASFGSDSPVGRLTYGFDAYHDDVDSFSSTNPIQGPVADDATYDLVGVCVQDEIEVDDRLALTLGARFNYAAADADSVSDPDAPAPTRISIDDDWSSLVGSARLVYRLAEAVRLYGGVSQGFRAPNLSDLTRFDSARTNEFETPSPGLDPEDFVTYEVGLKTEGDDLSSQLALFYTDIDDQIVRFPTGDMNAAGEFEITKDNVGDGYVWGVELGGAYRFQEQWTLFGNATFLEGKVETFPTSAQMIEEEYIDRLMPFTTQVGLRWDGDDRRQWVELVGIYADDADKLSTRDAGDTSRIPPGGTPDYLVVHARGGWRLHERATLNVAVENLTDEDYRIHGSGPNMPGLNFMLGLTASL